MSDPERAIATNGHVFEHERGTLWTCACGDSYETGVPEWGMRETALQVTRFAEDHPCKLQPAPAPGTFAAVVVRLAALEKRVGIALGDIEMGGVLRRGDAVDFGRICSDALDMYERATGTRRHG